MTPEQLIDHLDNRRMGKGSPETDQQITGDPRIALDWQYLRFAVDGIQEAGLYEQVKAVKLTWLKERGEVVKPSVAIVRTLYKNVMRVAAVIMFLLVGASIVKYSMTSSNAIYKKNFSEYDLSTTRGTIKEDALEEAYQRKNWAGVISQFNSAKEKDNKAWFLAGMADMELKQYDDAIGKFQEVIATNVQSGSDYFQDEAEFYLAMSWIGRNDVKEAMPLLEKIKGDKNHLYHDRVEKMSSVDLQISSYKKENKALDK